MFFYMFNDYFKSLPGELRFMSFANCPIEFLLSSLFNVWGNRPREKERPKVTHAGIAGAEIGYWPYMEKIVQKMFGGVFGSLDLNSSNLLPL